VLAVWGALIIGAVYMLRAVRAALHSAMPEKWADLSDANPWRKLPYALLLASLLVFGFFPRLLTDKIKPVTEQIVTMATVRAVAKVASNLKANFPLTPALSPSEVERENRSQSLDKSSAGGTHDDLRANESGRLLFPFDEPRSVDIPVRGFT